MIITGEVGTINAYYSLRVFYSALVGKKHNRMDETHEK